MSIPVVNYPIILDYTDKKNPDVPAIEILKSDTGTRKFSITLKSDGIALDITDLTVRIYFKKADGNITQGDPTVVDAATGQISYTLQTNDVAKKGTVECQITLSDSSAGRITTFKFNFDVLDTAYSDEAVQSTTEFSLLTQYVDNFKHFGEYDSGTTYYINNVVEYNDSSYIALQTTTGNDPPTYPTIYNDYWYMMAKGYPVTIEASNTTVSDDENYFESTDVEGALAELANGWRKQTSNIPTGITTMGDEEFSYFVISGDVTLQYPKDICFKAIGSFSDGDGGTIDTVYGKVKVTDYNISSAGNTTIVSQMYSPEALDENKFYGSNSISSFYIATRGIVPVDFPTLTTIFKRSSSSIAIYYDKCTIVYESTAPRSITVYEDDYSFGGIYYPLYNWAKAEEFTVIQNSTNYLQFTPRTTDVTMANLSGSSITHGLGDVARLHRVGANNWVLENYL